MQGELGLQGKAARSQGEDASWLGHRATLSCVLGEPDAPGRHHRRKGHGRAPWTSKREASLQRKVSGRCLSDCHLQLEGLGRDDDAQAWLPRAAPAAREALHDPGGETIPLVTCTSSQLPPSRVQEWIIQALYMQGLL